MSEKRNIARAAGVLGFATILSRIMGMVRDMVISRLFGAGYATDAFFAAFQIPNMLRRFFAEGALTSAFVPIFAEYHTQKGDDAARDLANTCFTLLTILMAGVVIAGILLSPYIITIMFPGYHKEAGKFALTVFLNRMMFPYIFFISLVALCMGILNTVRHFFTPAISTVFLNLTVIGCAVFLHTHFSVPIISVAIGVLLGGFIQLLLQVPALYRKGFPLRFRFNPKHPAVRRIAWLMGPSVFGVGVYYLNITVGNILASLLPQGSVSYLYYAQRLFEFPQGIFTASVAQAVLPSMSRQASVGDIDQLKESLAFGLKLILFVTIPAMVGLMICATPIFSLLFMGGAFTYYSAVQSAHALLAYAAGLSMVAMVRILAPAFYSMKDTRTPVITAFIAFILNALLSLLLMIHFAHVGLALASSLAAMANMILLLWHMRLKIGAFNGKSVIATAIKSMLASIPMGALVYWGIGFMNWSETGHKLAKAGVLLSTIGGGAVLFFVVAHLLRCDEAHEIMRIVKRRLIKNGAK